MVKTNRFLLTALVAVPVLLVNCRDPVDWDDPGQGGANSGGRAAGAGAEAGGSGGSGEGGDRAGGNGLAGAAACTTDADCGDGIACDGIEQCRDERCAPGEALACGRGTECRDKAGAPVCEFPSQSAWLVFNSWDDGDGVSRVQGFRTVAGAAPEPETFSVLGEDFPYVSTLDWSPSGRILIVAEQEKDLRNFDELLPKNRLMWMQFGRGLPSSLQPIPNLPRTGDYGSLLWDYLTDTVVVISGPEAYLVRFHDGEVETTLILTAEDEYSLERCPGDTALIYGNALGEKFLIPMDGTQNVAPVALGSASLISSPDGAKLVGVKWGATGDTQVAFLADCRAGAALTHFLEIEGRFSLGPTWSPDGKYLLFGHYRSERTLLEMVDLADPKNSVFSEEFSGEFVDGRWLSDEIVLLERASENEHWNLLHLDSGVLEPIEDAAWVQRCGHYLIIGGADPEASLPRVHFLDLRKPGEPQPLIEETPDELTQLRCDSSGERLAYVRYKEDSMSELPFERSIEILTLAAPERPALVYPFGSTPYIQLEEFHLDERGLIAHLAGPKPRNWWLPMPDGVAQGPRELPSSQMPRLQPWP